MVKITPTLSASDRVDPRPRIELVSITMSDGGQQTVYRPGGATASDIQVDAQGQIFLRADRLGSGSGRVYTLLFKATNASGNSSTATATVSVPHDKSDKK
jgi:hypothetical protein